MKIDDFLDSPTEQPKRAGGSRIDAFLDDAPAKRGYMDDFLDDPGPIKPTVIADDAIYDPISGVQIAGSQPVRPNPKSLLANSTLPVELRNLPGDKAALEQIEKAQRTAPGPQILNAQAWTPAPKRGVVRTAADTILGLYQGATGMVKGVADNFNAGDNPVSNALQQVIDIEERLKSGDLKEQQATRNMLIYGAKKNGEAAAARAAIQTLFDYPAAGGDVVARGAGSILPTVAMGALGAGTRVMGGVNAMSNAGDAASQTADALRALPLSVWANDPQYQALLAQGMDAQAAKELLIPIKALGPQVVGGVTGAASGFTGLERQLAGKVVGNTIVDRLKRAGTEVVGEQAETLFPQVAGNATVGAIDQRTKLLEGTGQAAVDTLAGTVPGALLAARAGQTNPTPAPSINPTITAPPAPLTSAQTPSPINAPTITPEAPVNATTPAAQTLSELITRSAIPTSTLPTNLPSDSAIDAFLDDTVDIPNTASALPVTPADPSVENMPDTVAPQALAPTPAPVEQAAIAPATEPANQPVNEPAFIDLDKHMLVPSAQPGMRIGDIVKKNGAVFKSRKDAKAVAKAAGPGWVTAPSNQGYLVRYRPQTDKQIAATAKRVAKQREVRTTDTMLQAISKLGGINSDELVSVWGISLADLKDKGSGVFRVAVKNGMSADRMADSLKELGYISEDENGKHDLNEMMDLFTEEARGGTRTFAANDGGGIEQQYSEYQKAGYDEWIAAKDAQEAALNELSEEAQTLIGEIVAEDYERTLDEDEGLRQEIAQWEQSGQSQDRIPDFNDEVIEPTGGRVAQEAGEFDTNPAGEDRGDQGVDETTSSPRAQQDSVRQTGTRSRGTTEETFSLETQTEAALKAADEAKAAAAKAKQEADRAADARAQADAEVGQFTLTGSDRAADVAAAQGQQDLLAEPSLQERLFPGLKNGDRVQTLAGTVGTFSFDTKNTIGYLTPDFNAGDIPNTTKEKFSLAPADNLTKITAAAPAPATNDIKDFGKKIGGAKKDVFGAFQDAFDKSKEVNLNEVPLSKSWPEPNYQKLLDSGADPFVVAFMRAARESIPTKPQKAYRVKAWADSVRTLKAFTTDLMSGTESSEKVKSALNSSTGALKNLLGTIELYQLVGHSKSLAGVTFNLHSYGIYGGVTYKPNKLLWVVERAKPGSRSSWPTELVSADTKQEALDLFQAKYDTLFSSDTKEKKVDFVIYSRGKSKDLFIGKKIGRNYADLAGPFATSKEAREYRLANQAALETKLEEFKKIPSVRRDVNAPRVGKDMRGSQDVTPQFFSDTFGFKGVEFGNWVDQGKRQQDLNAAFDALMDMAAVLDIPPKALSLNGDLGLAFGARGNGGVDAAAAHYEAGFMVINLTKKNGAGSLGHEWWHALDHYFARIGGEPLAFITESSAVNQAAVGVRTSGMDDVRREMIEAYGQVVSAIRKSEMKKRSGVLDGKRSKDYWSTMLEMTARSYETYLIEKLHDQDVSNDYLANTVSEEGWKAHEKMGMQLENSYPYPTKAEMPAIRAAFDHFFRTVETAPSSTGVRIFSSSPRNEASGSVTAEPVQALIDAVAAKFPGAPRMSLANKVTDLFPFENAESDTRVSGAVTGGEIVLFLKGLKGLRDAERTIFHELLHYGLRRFLTKGQFITQMNKLYTQDATLRAYADNWVKTDAVGIDTLELHGEQYALARGVDEALAVLAESNPEQYIKPSAWTLLQETLRKWMAQLAQLMGFTQYAAQLRALNPTQAQQLIRDTFTKLQDNAPGVKDPFVDMPDTAFRLIDIDENLQEDLSLDPPEKKYVEMSAADFAKVSKNTLGRFQWSGGEKLYRNMTIVAKQYLGAIKLADNKPAAFTQMLRQFRVDQQKANAQAKEIAIAGKELSPDQRVVLADLVENNARVGDMPTEEMVELAASVTQALEAQAQELVELGMLSPERLVKNYLPRLYKHGLSAALTNKDVFRSWFTKVRLKIRGNRLKSRGLYVEMPTSRVATAKKLGWTASSMTDGSEIPTDLFAAFDKSQPIPPNYQDTKVIMWRDYTEAERADMGEIRDGVLRYAMGYVDTQKDIAIGRLFKAIAGNGELAKTHNPGGWVKVPSAEIAGAGGIKQYGALSGMFVNPQVYDSLTRNTQPKGVLIAMYDKALSFWKEGKTVWNPVAHGNNVVSNLFTVHFAGINPLNPLKWRETMREFKTKGQYWTEAVDNGLFGTEFANEEIQKLLMPELSDLADIETLSTSRVSKVIELAKVTGKPLAYYREKMQGWYEFEDQFFKLMLFIDRRKQGLNPQDAITDAERYVFNYADIPEGIELIKRIPIGSPFFAYTYKAIPMVLHTAMTRPDRLLMPMVLLGGANWLAYALLGTDEEKERKGMPEYLQGRTLIGTPKAVRMPFNDEGKPAFMDISRRVPLGDLFDAGNKTNGISIPAPFMPSHPVFSIMQAVLFNQDTFTGKDLVKKSDTSWEAAQVRSAYLYRQFIPNAPMIPGSYNFNKLADAAAYSFDTEMGPYTGRTKAGDAIKPGTAVLDVFTGTKIRAFDPERGMDMQAAVLLKELKEIKANVLSAKRNESMTEKARNSYIAEQESKMQELERKSKALRQ